MYTEIRDGRITLDAKEWEDHVDKNADLKDFEAIFQIAKIPILKHWSLANPYWPDYHNYFRVSLNWFLFRTKYGLIKIGWRKRVISIEWEDTNIRKIVTEDNVTKDETSVHAWGEEKAVEYLKELVKGESDE